MNGLSQSYDNASNMSDIYKGVQTCIKEINSQNSFHVVLQIVVWLLHPFPELCNVCTISFPLPHIAGMCLCGVIVQHM